LDLLNAFFFQKHILALWYDLKFRCVDLNCYFEADLNYGLLHHRSVLSIFGLYVLVGFVYKTFGSYLMSSSIDVKDCLLQVLYNSLPLLF
jgi:hypothetical protein